MVNEWLVKYPVSLVTPDCFDLGAKVSFAKDYLRGIRGGWSEYVYLHHLNVWNGRYEANPLKRGSEAYLSAFKEIIDKVKDDKFDFKNFPVPVNNRGKIINGRHRVAAAIAAGKPIITRECPDHMGQEVCDYKYLVNKTDKDILQQAVSDSMATEYARMVKNTYVATVFSPHESSEIINTLRQFGRPVYWKTITLKGDGPYNLMRELYLGEQWLRGWPEGFSGAKEKAELCLSNNKTIGVYMFEADCLEHVVDCKKQLRHMMNNNRHSVHINDTNEETMRLVRVLFNENSIHFLNHAKFQKYPKFQTLLDNYRQCRKNEEDFCIDGSAIMSAYGLRDCKDLDFLDFQGTVCSCYDINNHNEEMTYHATSKNDIIYNPRNHLWHGGVKFVSLDLLKQMKEKRFSVTHDPKDEADIKQIQKILV